MSSPRPLVSCGPAALEDRGGARPGRSQAAYPAFIDAMSMEKRYFTFDPSRRS